MIFKPQLSTLRPSTHLYYMECTGSIFIKHVKLYGIINIPYYCYKWGDDVGEGIKKCAKCILLFHVFKFRAQIMLWPTALFQSTSCVLDLCKRNTASGNIVALLRALKSIFSIPHYVNMCGTFLIVQGGYIS